ncbi:hypothetical protein BLA29_009537 [Euroglyphus maynei]|uniref:PCAF N-terminal domain-containing protein n=1 Tax=Euroglyphus maynei TaxID=6958 RepID=A0A1Y3ARN4_EURMA|nr:hypothetical protein BLA29_009537 [Euroglyphus maynei]
MYHNNILDDFFNYIDENGIQLKKQNDNNGKIFQLKCNLCSHTLDQHLKYFHSTKPSLFNKVAILDDYLYKTVDCFHVMCLYSQSTLLQKRPLFTIYNLLNGYLCNFVDLEFNYRQPPFERPTIQQLLTSIANNNDNNSTIRKYSRIFLQLFDRHKFQSIQIDRTDEQSEQLKIFKELFLVFCLLPRTIKSYI